MSNLQFHGSIPPSLTASSVAGQVRVSWALWAERYQLESTTDPASTNEWINVTNPPAIVNLENVVTNGISDRSRFYRLVK